MLDSELKPLPKLTHMNGPLAQRTPYTPPPVSRRLPERSAPVTVEEAGDACRYLAQGLSLVEVAAILERRVYTVKAIVREVLS